MNNIPKDDNFNFDYIDKNESKSEIFHTRFIGVIKAKTGIENKNGLGERTFKDSMELVSQYYNCKSIANAFVKRIREFK